MSTVNRSNDCKPATVKCSDERRSVPRMSDIKQTTTLSNETGSCGQTLHRKLFKDDCCVVHGEHDECDENGKRICQCKKNKRIVTRESGACRLTGKSGNAHPHQDAKSFDAQQATGNFNNEAQEEDDTKITVNPETLETRNTIGTAGSGAMRKASLKTEKCFDIHHESCALASGGNCDHPHHDDCIEGNAKKSQGTRGGTDEGLKTKTVDTESLSLLPGKAFDDPLNKSPSQDGFENTPVPSVLSSSSVKGAVSSTVAPFNAADKSDYQTSTVDPSESTGRRLISKPSQQADALQLSTVDSTAPKDRRMNSDMGSKQPSTAGAFDTSLGDRLTEKDMSIGREAVKTAGRPSASDTGKECVCFLPK